MAELPESLPSRRNLPRASHACQRCRAKKAKCDQRQPCGNCTKHSQECTYGLRRRNARERNIHIPSRTQRGPSSPLPSPRDSQDEPQRCSETLENIHTLDHLVVDNADVVGDINQHTHGTEFYGTSSNFVLLNQFFVYAQQHLPPGHSDSNDQNETSYLSPASGGAGGIVSGPGLSARSPLSIVNLLSDKEVLEPPSRPKTPPPVTDKQQDISEGFSLAVSRARNQRLDGSVQPEVSTATSQNRSNGRSGPNLSSSAHLDPKESIAPETSLQVAKQRLEREYVRQFMNNLHHLHPMLEPMAFTARCEDQIWNAKIPFERNKDQRHFFALYNIVVAVGALVSGSSMTQNFERDINLCMKQPSQSQSSSLSLLSQELSKTYFRKSRALLGDVFEVCSLESAQTLLLMSLYCQNSLKPHACYMYCGHAVRTALAIGIARESLLNSIQDRKAARRTWWCIYSHEIDMSCSAGRRDSLGKPRNYQIDLPHIRDPTSTVTDKSDLENYSVAMINEMVHFAAILRRISKELYYDSKGLTLLQKSAVAKELDALLDDWKDQLPAYLDFGKVSFREEEWAAKQKLVLHLRYLNARIVLHRPFLEAPIRRAEAQMSSHVEICLEAARDTIRVMYDAYSNRHYFRTWWYNSTYTLYAGMVVLYIIMLGPTAVPLQELLDDVTRAQEILESMEEAVVARRSASLIREGLEVARACVQDQQSRSTRPEGTMHEQENDGHFGQLDLNDIASQFSYAVSGHDPALLASIIDPNLLQDFTAADKGMSGLEFSMLSFDGLYGDEVNIDPMSTML
ncbi:fungal-specific transcription factor domain-containing protein [Dactylonectria estremocensis]|uniref:Fungal-specific transcription factor domain-containing protein n=1 Tax=Dactylonectria estremocensis TaxID=1079267 RepID=A0A9P9D670_9HYPO|nr:fungal-specific transcription factor domain-containing protein [Dactylonectria estremocensis]